MDNKEVLDSKKERLDLLAIKNSENEQIIQQNEKLKNKCYSLSENIKYERESVKNIQNEIKAKENLLRKIEKTYKSVSDRSNPNSKKFVNEMKQYFIKQKLEEIIFEKIPELNINRNKDDFESEDNEFHDLLEDSIEIAHVEYNRNKKQENKTFFRISKKTTSKDIKLIACNYFDIENAQDYMITDDSEALIYDEEVSVNDYLSNYSVFLNCFKLMSISFLKSRTKLIDLQEANMRKNRLGKSEIRDNKYGSGQRTDNSMSKIKEFFSDYPGLKPFKLEEGQNLKDHQGQQSNSIETSFIMLLLLALFFILTLIAIYGNRDIGRNNLKIDYIKTLLDNSKVDSYPKLFTYINRNLLFLYANISTDGYTDDNLRLADNELWLLALLAGEENLINLNWLKPYKNPMNNFNWTLNSESFVDYLDDYKLRFKNFEFASSIRRILNRVSVTECSKNEVLENVIADTDKCFHQYYNANSAEVNFTAPAFDYGAMDITKELGYFKSASEAGVYLNVSNLLIFSWTIFQDSMMAQAITQI
jgi:hypothetical protein